MLNPILADRHPRRSLVLYRGYSVWPDPAGPRVQTHTDIRKAGSATSAPTPLRVAGPKVAALTLLLDCLKGATCVLIARPLIASVGLWLPREHHGSGAAGDWMLGVICLAAVWGHLLAPTYLPRRQGYRQGPRRDSCLVLAHWPVAAGHVYRPLPSPSLWAGGLACRRYQSSHRCFRGLSVQQPGPQVLHGDIIGITVVWAHRANIKSS